MKRHVKSLVSPTFLFGFNDRYIRLGVLVIIGNYVINKNMKISSQVSAFFGLLLVCMFFQITETQSQLLPPSLPCSSQDPDTNNNGLIDICDIDGLELMRNNPDGRYELRRSLDFNDPNSYRDPGSEFIFSWPPIEIFGGEFNGGGHTISNLPVDAEEDYAGLFSEIDNGARVENLGLLNINIIERGLTGIGGLAGGNGGEILNSYVINTDEFRIEADERVGGLVGENAGSIVNSHTTVEVHGNVYVGGLVGFNYAEGIIRNSRATGIVVVGESETGGLVGENYGSIIGSYADGSVKKISGSNVNSVNLGGLVGWNGSAAVIRNSYAIGTIEGSRHVGGLIGENRGRVINSYAKNKVSGSEERVGGLVGWNNLTNANIRNSYADGTIKGSSDVGGLIGENRGRVINSYAKNKVSGSGERVGGLVGWNNLADANIRNSYATGDVISTAINYVVGGLVGRNLAGTILNTYATGNVFVSLAGEETDQPIAAGGLVGYISSGTIENSYAIGLITESSVEEIGSLVGLNSQGTIERSYARNERNLIGNNFSPRVEDSFTTDTRILQLPIEASDTSTKVYYEWSENDWDFRSRNQYPVLRYAVGSDPNNPACGESPELPNCGTPLPRQPSSLHTYIKVLLEGVLQTD